MPPTKSNRQFVLIFYLTSFNAIDHCLFLCTFSPCGFDDVILWWFFGSSFLTKLQMLCPVLFLQYFCLTEPHSFCRWFHPIAWTEYHLICWGTPTFYLCPQSLSHCLRPLCSLQISTWMSNSHFKLKMSKTKLSIHCPASGNGYHHPLKEPRNHLLFLSIPFPNPYEMGPTFTYRKKRRNMKDNFHTIVNR